MTTKNRCAIITGASSGMGAATARALSAAGFELMLGARRQDRINKLASELNARAHVLDVTRPESIESFVAACPQTIDVLVNNAGVAIGLDAVEVSRDEDWRQMWETNVLGVVRLTRTLLPTLRRSSDPRLIVIGSTSSVETYKGGAGYTSTKHALRAVVRTLRLELLGEPIRVTEISPGAAETEFSIRRFSGDRERARAVYEGMRPLTGDDVAECVVFAATRPKHVNIDEIVVRPLDQASASDVYRDS